MNGFAPPGEGSSGNAPSSSAPSPGASSQAPADIYRTRLEERRGRAARLGRRHLLLGYLRLVWVLLFAALLWYVFARHALSWPWILLPLIGFGVTARIHDRVLTAAEEQKLAIRWYELGLARLEDRWAGLQPRPTPAAAGESLYAADLDLFGPGSLFELLCTARTGLGETILAGWLLRPAPPEVVIKRQTAVHELRDRLDLRERVASARGPLTSALDVEALAGWGEGEIAVIPFYFRWLSPVLALLTVAAAAWWALGHPPTLLTAVLLINGAVTYALQSRFKPLFEAMAQAAAPLQLLAGLFATLERETFDAPLLRSSQSCLQSNDAPESKRGAKAVSASVAIRRLARQAGAAEQRANLFARLLDFGVLYSVQLALRVQSWRAEHGRQLRSWLHAFGEIEALLALSAYHFEHPDDAFPEVATAPVFQTRALGHPLLPRAQCVRNDVALDARTQLLIVSGSNMSGKSTLLRSTGVACVMAMAGAPVRAVHLQLGPLRVAASIQVADSLQGGRSRFYAEILRLRSICELAQSEPPVLFLLDELLAGTNSHDRLAGATGVVETLLTAGALGLLSTHDLALTQLGPDLQARVRNAHFEDRIEGDGLQFDYTLRDGVIIRSNGLDLMRLIGLRV